MKTHLQEPASDDPHTYHTDASSQAGANTARQERRLQVITLLGRCLPIREVAVRTGYSPRTVSYIAQRYREAGQLGLADRRKHRSGAPPLLSHALQHELSLALQYPPLDGGRWTGPKVAQWIATKTGRPVHRQRGWEYWRRLRRAGRALVEEATSNG